MIRPTTRIAAACLLLSLWAGLDNATLAADDVAPLAVQAHAVLKKHCYSCHGVSFEVPGLNVLDREGLLADRGPQAKRYLVAGQPDASYLWLRLANGSMPPEDVALRPTPEEQAILQQWIAAGAPFPGREPREFRSVAYLMAAIRQHLSQLQPVDRPFTRYFTLTNIWNNYEAIPAEELPLYRSALSKLVNSLSWQNRIVLPRPIDADQMVFAIDLRDLGWDKNNLWQQILRAYPYGLKHDRSGNPALAADAAEVYRLAGNDLPFVRVDWFLNTAARTPLYETMLELPADIKDLEKKLNADPQNDFLRNRLVRGGIATSGVSSHNRLLDRHDALFGYYWKSYDFKSSDGNGNIFRHPLGPTFDNHPFPDQSFAHDGGEMIFSLPNGLQGYYLSDGKGKQITAGPVEVVSDRLKTSGTPAIVNGLSCMACHKHGVIRFDDDVAQGTGVGGDALVKVSQLFPSKERMNQILDADEARFMTALAAAVGPFLPATGETKPDLRLVPEMTSLVAIQYQRDLSPLEVASELSIATPAELQNLIKGNLELQQLGLGPLVQGKPIKRETWQSISGFVSQFQRAAQMLDQGTPHRVF